MASALEEFGTGVKRGGVGLLNLVLQAQGRPGVDPSIDVGGPLSTADAPAPPLPEPTDARGRIAQGIGESVFPMAMLAPMGAIAGPAALAADTAFGMLGASAGAMARESGVGTGLQVAADALGSITPAALTRRLATSGARRATGEAMEHLGYLGRNKMRAMRGLHDESANVITQYQRRATARGKGSAEDLRRLVHEVAGNVPVSSGSDAVTPTAFRRTPILDSEQPSMLSGKPIARFDLPDDAKARFAELGVSTPTMIEIDDPVYFHSLISESKASSKFGPAVHVYDVDEYADMRMFITEDGTAGGALKADGDLVSGFNTKGGPHKGISAYMQSLRISQGGFKTDAYNIDGGLAKMYSASGFDLDTSLPNKGFDEWDSQYRPDDWNDALLGKPDVVYLRQAKPEAPLPAPSYNPGVGVSSIIPRAGARVIQEQRAGSDRSISGLPPLLKPY